MAAAVSGASELTTCAVYLLSPDGPLHTVKKSDIRTRERGGSGMPDGFGQILSHRDLRDLIAFLASLR